MLWVVLWQSGSNENCIQDSANTECEFSLSVASALFFLLSTHTFSWRSNKRGKHTCLIQNYGNKEKYRETQKCDSTLFIPSSKFAPMRRAIEQVCLFFHQVCDFSAKSIVGCNRTLIDCALQNQKNPLEIWKDGSMAAVQVNQFDEWSSLQNHEAKRRNSCSSLVSSYQCGDFW